MTRCPSCSEEVPANARFCHTCGERVPQPAAAGDIVAIRSTVIKAGTVTLGAEADGGECPICGRHNTRTATFRCRGCNRPLICTSHQDPQLLLCSDCIAERQRKLRSVTIIPDGSGDLPTLGEAVAQCPPGATIHLVPGEFRLSDPLIIFQPMTLVGAGMEQTQVVCDAEGFVVCFAGSGKFSATGITFQHEGETWANVLQVLAGKVSLSQCGFTGAVCSETGEGGAGLRIAGDTRGRVDHCAMMANDTGIDVRNDAQPTLEANSCENNRGGIHYFDRTEGIALDNICTSNYAGIVVQGTAQPTLESNACGDGNIGISVCGASKPLLRQNTCTKNKVTGIWVLGDSEPTVEDNQCDLNGTGITYQGCNGGVGRSNQCSNNKSSGISLDHSANPTLERNHCSSNGIGIFYSDVAGGLACENDCSENKYEGIIVFDGSRPTLKDNRCRANEVGIKYFGTDGGIACGNDCSGNRKSGIEVEKSSSPMLEANTCCQNSLAGIDYASEAGGNIRKNSCSNNEEDGIRISKGNPIVEGNTCSNNGRVGLWVVGKAKPVTTDNSCSGNTGGDFDLLMQG